MLVKLLLTQGLKLHCTLLEGQVFLVCILGDLGGHVVPNDWVKARYKHETIGISLRASLKYK